MQTALKIIYTLARCNSLDEGAVTDLCDRALSKD